MKKIHIDITDEVVNFSEDLEIIFKVSEYLKKHKLKHVLNFSATPLTGEETKASDINEKIFAEVCEMVSMREVSRYNSLYDAIASQFSLSVAHIPSSLMESYQEIEFFAENLQQFMGKCLENHISSQCPLIFFDTFELLYKIAECLSCVIIVLSSATNSVTSIIPNSVKLPVPIFIGHINIVDTKFVSMQYNALISIQEKAMEETIDELSGPVISCRCGENKKKTSSKPSCLNTLRCRCFSGSLSCSTCKCSNCENPFGKQTMMRESERKKKQSQRQLDAKGGHAGKLIRRFHPGEHDPVKFQLNMYEKILLKRILKASGNTDPCIIFELYIQYVRKKSDKLIHIQTFEVIKKATQILNINKSMPLTQ